MTSPVFTQTAGDLIKRALLDAKIIPAEQPLQDKDFFNGLNSLQSIIKHWQTQGIHLWSEIEGIIPLITGQRKYLLGPGGDDIALASTFFNTTLSADTIATDTVLPLTATSGLTADGQAISIQGAPLILTFNPALTLANWTAIGGGVLSIVSDIIQVENTLAVGGGGLYQSLETEIGRSYRVFYTYVQGTAPSALFSVTDSAGTIVNEVRSVSGDYFIDFTARENLSRFAFQNNSIGIGDTTSLASLNYADKSTGDRIGIELDSGARVWTNVVTVDSATQVSINDALPSDSAESNSVYTYATKITRPLRVLQTRFGETITASEIPTEQWTRADYFDQPDKDSAGTIVNWYYTPTLTNGELYVWQVASSINQVLRFTYVEPIDIPLDIDDALDFPSEWFQPLRWAIASDLGPAYGISAQRQVIIDTKATTTLNEALDFDVDRSSMSLQPDFN